MFGMLKGLGLKFFFGRNELKELIEEGVNKTESEINALACRDVNSLSVMVWNYHDNDISVTAAPIEIAITGLPQKKVMIHEYRIDNENSNSFELWKKMGSPQNPTPEQFEALVNSGQFKLFTSPSWIDANPDKPVKIITFPHQGLTLFKFTW